MKSELLVFFRMCRVLENELAHDANEVKPIELHCTYSSYLHVICVSVYNDHKLYSVGSIVFH